MKLKEYKKIFNIIKFGSSIYNCAVGNYIPDEYTPVEWTGGFGRIVKPLFKESFYETRLVSDYNSAVSVLYKTKEFKREQWYYYKEYKQPIRVFLWKRIS